MGCARFVPRGFRDSAWAFTLPFCASLGAGPSAAPAPLAPAPLGPVNPSPGSWPSWGEAQTSSEPGCSLLELLAARRRRSSREPSVQHACKPTAETCWERVCGRFWALRGFSGCFYLADPHPGLVLLSRDLFSPPSAFTYVTPVKAARGFAPCCAGARQAVFAVGSRRWPQRPGLRQEERRGR